jgi:hypothetical protein
VSDVRSGKVSSRPPTLVPTRMKGESQGIALRNERGAITSHQRIELVGHVPQAVGQDAGTRAALIRLAEHRFRCAGPHGLAAWAGNLFPAGEHRTTEAVFLRNGTKPLLLRKMGMSGMPLYDIEYECNGHTERSFKRVDLADFAEAAAYALSAAPLLQDLIPGERRECAFEVRDASEGWRLKIGLEVCLDSPEPATDDIDGGLLDSDARLTEY